MMVRWGFIGCGDVCEVKSGPAFGRIEGSSVSAVMRRDGRLAGDYARRHGIPRSYDDADRLAGDDTVDAVYVASPVGSHLEHALRACRAGKPCYVEKPIARSHAEGLRMVEAFEAAGIPLFVAYYRRALPRFLQAKEWIDGGRIGAVTAVTCVQASPAWRGGGPFPWRLRAEESGGGLFMDLACHALDAIDFLVGPLAGAAGAAANRASPHDVEDSVTMSFAAGGVPGSGRWDFAAFVREDLIVIDGTGGRISLPTFGPQTARLETASGVEDLEMPNPPHIQEPFIRTVVAALEGRGPCPSTGRTALRTAAAMDRALEGYYGGRDDAFWERPGSWPGRPRRD